MKIYKDINPNYLHKIFTLIMLIMLISASGGLGIVWLRQQISMIATRSQKIESKLVIIERNIRNLDAKIGEIHNPKKLLRHATDMKLSLSQPREDQIVRLTPRGGNNFAPNVIRESNAFAGNLVANNP